MRLRVFLITLRDQVEAISISSLRLCREPFGASWQFLDAPRFAPRIYVRPDYYNYS